MTSTRYKIIYKNSNDHNCNLELSKAFKKRQWLYYLSIICLVIILFIPDANAASGGSQEEVEVFKNVTNKVISWIDGGFGKMVIVLSLVATIFMGIMGFKVQQILIPITLGLLLMSVKMIAGLFF